MTSIRVDVREIEAAAARLERVDGPRLGRLAVDAVNEVTTRFDEAARARIVGRVNLTPAYVKSKTDLTLATSPTEPKASIVVSGPARPGRAGLTILARYGPRTHHEPGAQRRAGPVAGQRSAGVVVEIGRGRPVLEPQWFLMRLRNVGEDGVFVRTSAKGGKPKHIYGPSPYSLFRQQIAYHEGEVANDLESTALKRLGDAVGEII